MHWVIFILTVLHTGIYSGGVTVNFQVSNKVPMQGNSLQLFCLVNTTLNDGRYDTSWSSPSIATFGKCFREQKVCTGGSMTRLLTADENGSYLNIQVLNRSLDEGRWKCIYNGQGQIQAELSVTVYTVPSGLNFTQVPNRNVDLSVTSAQLQCTTSGCTYPPPLIQWLIQGQSASSPYQVYTTLNPTGTRGSCVLPEQFYTSTLDLQQNTTLSDNSDKVLIFSCRIEYPDSSMNLIASGSQTVRFAVRVTKAFLQNNNQNITSTMTVTSGEKFTLACVTGTSRPAPNINWYIGSRSIGSGTSLIFTPSNTDHNEVIYCQAYNIDPNLKVDSNKPSFFVRVRVTEAFLQQNNQNITSTLTVTSGETYTLACITGTSRPAPNINWYIGSRSIGSGTSLIFTPSNTDHNEVIFCQAYNIDPNLKVDSNKAILFVRVRVTKAFLQNNNQNITSTMTVTSGEKFTLACVTGTSRPAPNINWYIGSRSIGSGTSLIFTPSNTDHNEVIYCQAYNIDPNLKVDSNKPSFFVRVYVSSVTLEGSTGGTMVFDEGYPQILKCNSSPSRPVPIIRWLLGNKYMTNNITNINIIDTDGLHVQKSEMTLVLMRNSSNQKVSCEGFISGQGTIVISTEVIVDVRYAPDVRVNVSGSTVVGYTAVLMCTPQGNPPLYTFHPWIHRVGQTEIRRLNGVNTLSLSNISIQDMGTYICTVDNSITGLDGQVNQIADTHMYVQGLPVFDRTQITFAGERNKSANIEIPFYSYSSIKMVKFVNQSDSLEISNTSNIAIYMSPANITMMFYGKKVMISGHVAVLHFRNMIETDFGNYALQLSNDWGTVFLQFDLIVSDPPSPVAVVRDFPVGAVAGGVVGGILLVIAIIVVAFAIKRRRTLKPKMEENKRRVSLGSKGPEYTNTAFRSDINTTEYEALQSGQSGASQYEVLDDPKSKLNQSTYIRNSSDPRPSAGELLYDKLQACDTNQGHIYSALSPPDGGENKFYENTVMSTKYITELCQESAF